MKMKDDLGYLNALLLQYKQQQTIIKQVFD